jgi:hypothetical protein
VTSASAMSGAFTCPVAMTTAAGGAAIGWVLRAAVNAGQVGGRRHRFRTARAAVVVDMVVAGTAAERVR